MPSATAQQSPGPGVSTLSVILCSCLAIVCLGGVALLFTFDPARHGFFPLCLFHHFTGWLCPGCGSLRALHRLLHGDLMSAVRLNPLLVASLPVLLFYGARGILSAAGFPIAPVTVKPVVVWAAIGITVIFGVVRNLV